MAARQGQHVHPVQPAGRRRAEIQAWPRIRPWRSTVIRLYVAAAIAFLQRCQDRPMLKPGVALGLEVAYWYRAHLFTLSLATRQQYLPTVTGHGDQLVAAWRPLFAGTL